MKKAVFFLMLCFILTHHAPAQNKKLYVSERDGKSKVLLFGKTGYNDYYYTSSSNCDTLICKGKGYERCRLDKSVFGKPVPETKYYDAFNAAIHKAEKHIRKANSRDGHFSFADKGVTFNIKYYNADKKGGADMEIEIL